MTQRQSQVNVSMAANKGLLTIKKFAELCRTTPRTIRFYDQKGLLNPVHIDRYNKYRYYSPLQARKFFRIRLLQNFHIPLEKIKSFSKIKTTADVLGDKLAVVKAELDEKQSEYEFLKNMKFFLFDTKTADKLLKEETIGPFTLFCTYVEKGRYDKINSYIDQLFRLAEDLKIPVTLQPMVFYLDPVSYKPKDTKLEIALVCKLKEIPKKIDLQKEYYFKKFPMTRVRTYSYKGPFKYITLIYQKLYEGKENRKLKPKEVGMDLHPYGPWNRKSEYDFLTKIAFPITTH